MNWTFEIGSFVRLAISANQVQTSKKGEWRLGAQHREMRGQVISRRVEECEGGVQRHYAVRWTDYEGSFLTSQHWFNELELVPSEAFPAIPEKTEEKE